MKNEKNDKYVVYKTKNNIEKYHTLKIYENSTKFLCKYIK